MTSKDFIEECEKRIIGQLFDATFNRSYQEQITLTIAEMRFIAHLLQAHEGVPQTLLFDPNVRTGVSND